MSKVICDICGTVYPDTSETCPICGYSRAFGVESLEDQVMKEEAQEAIANGMFADRRHKEIFDFDEVNGEEEDIDDDSQEYGESVFTDDDEDFLPRPPKTNMALVVVLVILITLLLAATAFLFFGYYLPNAGKEVSEPTETLEITAPVETTEAVDETAVPCQRLVLTNGTKELNKEGQLWLLHVKVIPEDTTDPLFYTSLDETVATVSESGRIMAVGEGQTTIEIACGTQKINCTVVVRYEENAEAVTDSGLLPEMTVGSEQTQQAETDAAEQASQEETIDAEDEVEETNGAEATEVTEAESETEAELKDVELKLKKYEANSNKKGVSFPIELDCELEPEEVTWYTMNSEVAIVHDGLLTTIGPGVTKIIAEYGDQRVEYIIRCIF